MAEGSSSRWPSFRASEASSSAPSSGPSSSPVVPLSGATLLRSLKKLPPNPTLTGRSESRPSRSTTTAPSGWARDEALIAIVGEPFYGDPEKMERIRREDTAKWLAKMKAARTEKDAESAPKAVTPTLIHIAPDRKKPICGVRGGRAAESPDRAILTVDVWCSRCLTKWEKAHGPATMLNGLPARSRLKGA